MNVGFNLQKEAQAQAQAFKTSAQCQCPRPCGSSGSSSHFASLLFSKAIVHCPRLGKKPALTKARRSGGSGSHFASLLSSKAVVRCLWLAKQPTPTQATARLGLSPARQEPVTPEDKERQRSLAEQVPVAAVQQVQRPRQQPWVPPCLLHRHLRAASAPREDDACQGCGCMGGLLPGSSWGSFTFFQR